MPEETQIQSEEIVEEKPKTGFLEKLRIHKGKILGGIFGVLVFVGAVFGAYKIGQKQVKPGPGPTPTPEAVATPTPDPTANWKTYMNTKYGYSIKYPGDWYIDIPSLEGKHESNKTLLRIDVTNSSDFKNAALLGKKKDILNISLSVWDNEDSKPLDSVLAEWDSFFQNPGPDLTSIKEINQIKWVRRELVNADGLPTVDFATLKRKYLYIVVISPRDSTIVDFADLMLSTFKFLPSTSSGQGEKVFCKEPRPQVCTMECIQNPPYICGSDEKSYCSTCQACSNPKVEWYVIQDKPCGTE